MFRSGARILFLLVCACAAWSQGTTSRVLGTVVDSSGAVVPNASVKLTNEGTHVAFDTKTSETGTYVFEAVQPGSYQLDVEAGGFRKYTSRANAVNIGQPATINVRLEIGTLVDAVEVVSAVETVQTSSSGNY